METNNLLQIWEEARARFSNQLEDLLEEDLLKKLTPAPNSVGFLIRHIADVELLFAKNVFGIKEIKVSAKTVIHKKDTGEWIELKSLLEYQNYAYNSLKSAILAQKNEDWTDLISTKEFGTKTKQEALARIISHTAYHAGQMALAIKYGSIN